MSGCTGFFGLRAHEGVVLDRQNAAQSSYPQPTLLHTHLSNKHNAIHTPSPPKPARRTRRTLPTPQWLLLITVWRPILHWLALSAILIAGLGPLGKAKQQVPWMNNRPLLRYLMSIYEGTGNYIPFFKTTIQYLGGYLSAYTKSCS
ncbi:hypothetical protein BKA70DRAFT_1432038 [Coprinopsis sp. MPI-PUGE-AT-0042]|nr:hypothetical protein BKA70DRAFT_1432038 [Coprinopsis sp. MPI-PUGE-AT-0042]